MHHLTKLFVALAIVGLAASAGADTDAEAADLITIATPACVDALTTATTLNSAQRHALARAATDGFSVDVLTKIVDGRRRTVAVVGEAHFKSAAHAATGRDLLDVFDLHGLESPVDVDAFWFPQHLARMLDDTARFVQSNGVGGADVTDGSTIQDALTAEAVRAFEDDIIRLNLDAIARGSTDLESSALDIMTRDYVGIVAADRGTAELAGRFDRAGMVARLRSRARPTADSDESTVKRTFDLEAGHRPSLTRKIWMAALVVGHRVSFLAGPRFKWLTVGGSALSVATLFATNGQYGLYASLASMVGTAAYITVALGLDRAAGGAVAARERDPQMAASIDGVWAAAPDLDDVLVLVGAMHAPGVVRELTNVGYEDHVSLPLLIEGRPLDLRPRY